jgi:probable HAF family extracellular repeat protein
MNRKASFAGALSVAILLPALCTGASYTITDLGTVSGYAAQTVPSAINDAGQVVGTAHATTDPSSPIHAFLYSSGAIHDLGTLGGANSGALGLNNSGQITGYADLPNSGGQAGPTQAFLVTGGIMQTLGSLVIGDDSHGAGINSLGQVVGDSAAVVNNQSAKDVFLYSGGVMNDLGNLNSPGTLPTSPHGINDSGQITGTYVQADGHTRAFIYTGGVLQSLGTLGGNNSSASAISNSGQAVGSADLGGGISHAFLFDGAIHDLGSLGTGYSYAQGLNNLGQVVGSSDVSGTSHAFLAGPSPMSDLNLLINPASGWVLNTANAINDLGQITGTGTFDGQSLAYLLTPVPEPSSVILAALGLIGLAALGWRRKRSRIAALAVSTVLVTFAGNARAVTMAWSPVGNPSNAADTASYGGLVGGFGGVSYTYSIGTYDVTNSQYVEMLNAKDPTGADPLGLFNSTMNDPQDGGIKFVSGNLNGDKYTLVAARQNWPVIGVNWFDAARFANWLNNGQGSGDTETGSYTLLGGTPIPSNASSIVRNSNATIVIPTQDEWYKAAYYSPTTNSYFQYPTSSNIAPVAELPPGGTNSANYNLASSTPTNVGAYSQSPSPYGTFDQGGNVFQWTEGLLSGGFYRSLHGASPLIPGDFLLGAYPTSSFVQAYEIRPATQSILIGFRLAMVPEPSSVILAAFGIVSLAVYGWRRKHA